MNKQKLPFWRTPSGWSAIGLMHETHTNDEQTFKEQTEDNDQYRQGYIEGLEQARKERRKTESDNAR